MVQSLHDAIRDALADTRNRPGMCLQQVQTWYEIPPAEPHAAAAWRGARFRCPGDKNPPRGAPVFWTGGRHGFGHIAMALGDGTIRSSDANGSGRVGTVDLDWVRRVWGLRYEGWTADLENVPIPELVEIYRGRRRPRYSGGGVAIRKLRYGQTDSNSVRRLQHRLNQISLPAPGNITLPITGNYADLTDLVVRTWQAHIGDDPDPEKQSCIGPVQAKLLFEVPPYELS